MYQTLNLTAGQRVEFTEAFDFVRIMDASASVDLEFYRDGREVDEALSVGVGFSEQFAKPCTRLVIVNGATAQTIRFATRLGSRVEFDRPPTGTVNVERDNSRRGNLFQTLFAVGTGNTQLHGGDGGRVYLMVINNSDTADVWITVDGTAPDVSKGIKLGPRDSIEFSGYCPTGGIRATASAAATNVVTLVGIY